MNLDQFVRPAAPAPVVSYDHGMFAALMPAGERFDARTDSFAQGKGATCRDMAEKLARFGRFASQKQADFATKLVEWSKPREGGTPVLEYTPRPNTWAAVQNFARVTIGPVRFVKKNGEPLWFIKFADAIVGKLEAKGATGFARKIAAAGLDPATIKAALDTIERDPLAAIKAHGIATGSCGCCGRELTDPESIAAGIGPICAAKF